MNEWIKQYSPNFNIARPGSESILSNTGHLASCGSQAGGQHKRITFSLSYRLSVWLKSERQHCLVASMKQAWWVHLNYKKNIQSMVLSGKLLLLSVCTTAFFHKRSAEMKVKNASNHLEKRVCGALKSFKGRRGTDKSQSIQGMGCDSKCFCAESAIWRINNFPMGISLIAGCFGSRWTAGSTEQLQFPFQTLIWQK